MSDTVFIPAKITRKVVEVVETPAKLSLVLTEDEGKELRAALRAYEPRLLKFCLQILEMDLPK